MDGEQGCVKYVTSDRENTEKGKAKKLQEYFKAKICHQKFGWQIVVNHGTN